MSDAIRLGGAGVWRAEPVPAEAKAEHLRAAETRIDEMLRVNRAYRRQGFLFGLFGLAVGAVGIASAMLFPRRDVVPVFFTVSESTGEVREASGAADAPRYFSDDTARSYLRTFVETCDGYLYQTAEANAHRCALLLTPDQQQRFNVWFTSRNVESPQANYGRNGSVRPERFRFTRLADGRADTQVWQVRYTRVEIRDGNLTRRPWAMTVQFQWRPKLTMTDDDRTLNPAGFQALDYVSQPDPGS